MRGLHQRHAAAATCQLPLLPCHPVVPHSHPTRSLPPPAAPYRAITAGAVELAAELRGAAIVLDLHNMTSNSGTMIIISDEHDPLTLQLVVALRTARPDRQPCKHHNGNRAIWVPWRRLSRRLLLADLSST